ncbi:DUF1540 domain-containing protein [Metallumcola ferriviriculae]|uniref:DUF1540 domain-containing protein n=1 Tax=Metallumcola ferriviriculae TaxID=3039180 RepID=A0AAU0USA8_9FIRM|nr:DUF1540 domain-containing protein [Desulfitibacteraceae bacterium MK1]
MSKIHCTVNNCHYYKQGNICDASEILVTSDQIGATLPDNADATQAQNMGVTPTNTCMETCCKSFVHQNSAQTNVDGIIRK